MVREVAESIGNISKEKDQIKPQLGDRPKIFAYQRTRTEFLNVEQIDVAIDTRNIGGDTGIYGNSTFGIYGTSKYGSTAQQSFILGNSLAGILGTSKLGSQLSAYTTIVQRRWQWFTESELNEGTKDSNISVTGGIIKLV